MPRRMRGAHALTMLGGCALGRGFAPPPPPPRQAAVNLPKPKTRILNSSHCPFIPGSIASKHANSNGQKRTEHDKQVTAKAQTLKHTKHRMGRRGELRCYLMLMLLDGMNSWWGFESIVQHYTTARVSTRHFPRQEVLADWYRSDQRLCCASRTRALKHTCNHCCNGATASYRCHL